MKFPLAGKSCWVTGAGAGIGRALVRELNVEGAAVVAIDRDAKALSDLSREAELLGFKIRSWKADVGAGEDYLKELGAAAALHGPPAVMVSCAGIARLGGFKENGWKAFEETLPVNLNGLVLGSIFALPLMEAKGAGVIVNIASMAGLVPTGFMVSYSTSKYAVVGFTRALQAELDMRHSPVRTLLVCPGFIDTRLMDQKGFEVPGYMRWLMVGDARTAALGIVDAVKTGKREVTPDLGGRLMRGLHGLAPRTAVKLGRLLVAKSWRQALGRDPIEPPE